MNSTDPTNAQFAAYRAMWSYFNATLFGGALGDVFLNFSRLARSLGFFAPDRWRDVGDQVTHEISLNPAHLKRDNAKDAAATLVHEMVHLWRWYRPGAPRNGYHDLVWAKKMEELGLMPSSTGAPGGKRRGYKMCHYIIAGGAFERAFEQMPAACHLPWTCGIEEGVRGKKKEAARKVKVKYTCSGCELNVWGRGGLRLRCEKCDQELTAEGGEDGEGREVDECVSPVRKAA